MMPCAKQSTWLRSCGQCELLQLQQPARARMHRIT